MARTVTVASVTVPVRAAAVAVLAIALLAGCSSEPNAPAGADAPSGSTSGATAGASTTDESTAVDTLMARGLEQVDREQYPQARGTFEAILALDPDNHYATYNLGFIAQRQGDDSRAIDLYAKTIALDDSFAPALYNLAILTEGSDLDAAAAFYRRVLELEPDDAPTMVRLGHLLQHQGRTAEGERLVERGVELDPALADVPPPTYAPAP